MKKGLNIVLIASFYFLIAAAFTLPVLNHFTTHIPGVDEDSPTHVWYLWWFKWAVFDQKIDPFLTNYIFYPQTINRIFDVHTIPLALISTPLQYLWGTIVSANIVFYLGFVLSGLGSYRLTKYITQSTPASLLSGLIFAFFPYTFGQITDNHTNLYTTWFIPFYLLFLLKSFKEKGFKNPLLTGFFLGLQSLNDLTYTSFTLVLTLLVFLYEFIFERKELITWANIKKFSLMVVVFLILSFPITSRAFKADGREFSLKAPLWVQDFYSADPSYFWQPAAGHPLLGKLNLAPSPKYGGIEGTLFIGFTVLILALFSLKYFKESRLFLFLAVSFFVLMLGPTPSLFNHDLKIPLPFYFFHVLPFIGGIKEPVRMDPFFMLPVAILAGITTAHLLKKFRGYSQYLVLGLLAILVLFEYYPGQIPTTNLTPPSIYNQIAQEKGDFTVLDLPVGWSTGNFGFGVFPIGSLQYFQSIHQKKIFRGTVARLPVKNVEYYKGIPGLKFLADPSIGNKDDQNSTLVRKTFKDLKIKYIIVHKKYYDQGIANNYGGTLRYLEDVVGAKKVYEQNGVLGYLFD